MEAALVLIHSLVLLSMTAHIGDTLGTVVVFIQMVAAAAVIALLCYALKHEEATFLLPHLAFQVDFIGHL